MCLPWYPHFMTPFSTKSECIKHRFPTITWYTLTPPHWENNFFVSKASPVYLFPVAGHFPLLSYPFSLPLIHFYPRSFHLCWVTCQPYCFSTFPLAHLPKNPTLASSGCSICSAIFVLPFTNKPAEELGNLLMSTIISILMIRELRQVRGKVAYPSLSIRPCLEGNSSFCEDFPFTCIVMIPKCAYLDLISDSHPGLLYY